MNAKATEFLADLYETSEPPALSTAKAAPAPELGRVHPGAGRPVDLGDLLPATGEWDELPDPEPCPTCGEILAWWGLWNQRRCERCEPSGQRSRDLADRAARARARQ